MIPFVLVVGDINGRVSAKYAYHGSYSWWDWLVGVTCAAVMVGLGLTAASMSLPRQLKEAPDEDAAAVTVVVLYALAWAALLDAGFLVWLVMAR